MNPESEKPIDWKGAAEELGPRLYRSFLSRFEPEDAADLTQETLLRLVRAAGRIDSSKGSLAMFAFGIARLAATEHRRKSRLKSVGDGAVAQALQSEAADSSSPLEAELARKREAARLREAIAQLPEAQQEALALVMDEELSLAQAAAILDLPLNTLKSHLHRAKARLAELLSERAP